MGKILRDGVIVDSNDVTITYEEVDLTSAGGGATSATDLVFTPTVILSATNVQAALAELDTEKATTASGTSEASARATAVTNAITTAEGYTDTAIATEVTDRDDAITAAIGAMSAADIGLGSVDNPADAAGVAGR